MALRTVVDCDRCKKETPTPGTIYLTVGYSTCPAGGRGEDDSKRVDLCPECLVALVSHFQKALNIDYEQSRDALEWVKKGK